MDKYDKFKHLLEYFVSHLEWIVNRDKSHIGYAQYIKPILKNGFKEAGQGWNDGAIQEQIKDWCEYDQGILCINVYAANYQSRGTYINWKGTWCNVRPCWKNDHVIGFSLTRQEKTDSKREHSCSIVSLGLFDGAEPNKRMKYFFDYYQYLYMGINDKTIEYIKLLKANKNMILTGAPGTGKTYLAQQIAKAMGAQTANERCSMVQFHPSYDYTDFVEGLRPTQPDSNGNIGFERVDGVFKSFCKKACRDIDNDYVFIIDEINRGEISKIFGELFFSIDPGYRGGASRVRTQYQNLITDPDDEFAQGFYVPTNVYVIGTMNDIDRSVESMDFAMRRRFAWKAVEAKDNTGMLDGLSDLKADLVNTMERLNNAISSIEGLNASYHIGGAYFAKISQYLDDDMSNKDDAYLELWNNHLRGVLYEYVRGTASAEEDMAKLENAYYNR